MNVRKFSPYPFILAVFLLIFSFFLFQPVDAASPQYSLRFYGHGVNDIDRVKIKIDPHVPADVTSDFTIEFWLKASLAENSSPVCTPGSYNWIYGNIIVDRDVFGNGDYGDYGISLSGGIIAFGVGIGSTDQTICGTTNVADGNWHHIAVTRNSTSGAMAIFIDGVLQSTGTGPTGNISYRDGRSTSYPNSDPYLVLGAEKHDAGSNYPSFSGFLDELRISTVIRYTSNFSPPVAPFTPDAQTAALYHFDEGPAGPCTGTILDAISTSPGQCNYGGTAPSGPVYVGDIPFAIPLVTSVSLVNSYSGSGPSSFTVQFNLPVADPPGNSVLDDVTNPANYFLIEKGPNAIADTASCAGGLSGDDVQQTVMSVSYNSITYTSTVTLTGPLPVGNYRLFVCGTTSIVSQAANVPLNNGSDFTFDFVVVNATPPSSSSSTTSALPATGFPMGRVTTLPQQPVTKAYTAYDELTLEIPTLRVKSPIVGVLKSGNGWDVSWLGSSIGWLEGSAFPTWRGNTVLTGHVWNADNTPGVFNQIKMLKYGDRVIIHAFGQNYVYEVRENTRVWSNNVSKVFKHEEYDWVTLLTCEGYNPITGKYLFRRMARAVLVEIR